MRQGSPLNRLSSALICCSYVVSHLPVVIRFPRSPAGLSSPKAMYSLLRLRLTSRCTRPSTAILVAGMRLQQRWVTVSCSRLLPR